MKRDNHSLTGMIAGIAAGVSYGMNPLFAKPLLTDGVSIPTMLFFRYAISVIIMAAWMKLKGESFRVKADEFRLLVVLGLLFSLSSLFLFESYRFIPSGLATTLVYLYPIFVALIMVALKSYPTWQTWIAIAVTFAGVILLSLPSGRLSLHAGGMILAALSALSYAFYLVIVNRSTRIRHISEHTLTFYALAVGTALFICYQPTSDVSFMNGVNTWKSVLNLTGLAVFPTMISLLMLAIATRYIGPTRTAVLGVFEPITAILIGTLLFLEPITQRMVIGITLCLAAVLFMSIHRKSK
ncbi:MAG: DMT family transporter [Bacteroidaceae bacterium]|jgi:Predicted permease, DMT superfamily|nr:DMT family transporter [Bacteroidaceae bacterium]